MIRGCQDVLETSVAIYEVEGVLGWTMVDALLVDGCNRAQRTAVWATVVFVNFWCIKGTVDIMLDYR